MPNVDSVTNDQETARLVANGKEVTVTLDLGYPAQLVTLDPGSRDNRSMTVCDTNVCVGSDYKLEVEFDSSPAPAILEWVIR